MTMQTLAVRSLRGLERTGGLLTRPRRARYLYLTAFFLPVLVMGVVWAVNGVIPFGGKMILAHDQWHQYYPFYLDLRDRLQNGQSLFHSWTTGMGTNYLSLFAYYLASPLNLPAALLPDSLVMVWYSSMVLVRLGLAGLFCAFFLKKTFGREELAVVAFSTAYAFCAFFMGYYWNAIWLDTVALLPLVTLGTFSLLRERRYVLYVVSLSLSVYCSYYIGLFICIWVLLLFIGWHLVNWDDMAGFWTRFWRIALFTAIALGMTAVLTIPAYLGLQSTSSAVNKFPPSYAMNIVRLPKLTRAQGVEMVTRGRLTELYSFFGRSLPSPEGEAEINTSWCGVNSMLLNLRLGYLKGFFAAFRLPLQGLRDVLSNTGSLVRPTTMEGGPNIACGFITLILATLYLFCRRIPLRERIFTVLLLLFFANSFLFRMLDYLWHGMHFPNMLPYRFSFLWSFTVIFMAFRAYMELEHLTRLRAVLLVIPVTLLLYCVLSAGVKRVSVATALVAAFGLGLLLLYSFRVIKKEHLVLALCVCMLAESMGILGLGVSKVGFTSSAYYPTKKEDSAAVVETMLHLEEDTVDLWRAEVAMKQTLNDSTLLGFNGVSVFSSAANSRVSGFMQSIGIAASVAGNRYVYQEADPFTNLLLGIKYLVDRNGRNLNARYFRETARQGEVVLLENQAYLTLGWMVGDNALDYDATQLGGLPYDRLNRLFREMTGQEEELYSSIPIDSVTAQGSAELSGKTSTGFSVSGECDEDNYVEASIVMPADGILCLYSRSTNSRDVSYYLNGEQQYSWSDSYGYNRCMGSFTAGDRISLRYQSKPEGKASVTLGAALFRSSLFDKAYALLSESSMIPTQVSDTHVEGAVRVYEPGLLYLAIPADEGWTLTVDGQPTRITPVGGAMIAAHLEPGLHAIVLDYETPGFALGLRISVICLAAFLVFLIVALISRFSRPPIVKVPVSLADPRRGDDEPDADAPPAAEPLPPPPAGGRSALDLTQAWDQGAGVPDLRAELSAGDESAAPPSDAAGEETRVAPLSDAPRDGTPVPPSDAGGDGARPEGRRELLSTTGVFDPSLLPPERKEPGSFDALAYLDRLNELLDEENSRGSGPKA